VSTLAEWQLKVERLANRGRIAAVHRALVIVAMDAEGEAKLLATTRMRTRSGALRRSIRGTASGTTVTVTAGEHGGEPLKYARIQELGGTVRPTRAKYLSIPVGPALTAAGVSKYASPRQVPGLHFVQSLKGQPLLADQEGTVWFVLKKSVTIKAKHFLRDGLRAAITNSLQPAFDQELAKEIRL